MEAVDGLRPVTDLDGAEAREAEAFRALSRQVRAASAPRRDPPDFDLMWAGVEARVGAVPEAAPAGVRTGWLARPFLVLAPAGAVLVAAVLGTTLWLGRGAAAQDNRCYVDSSEADEGSVLIDQDLDDPERATVIWFVSDQAEG